MAKIIAFDFDGVIADSAKGWAFFCRRVWRKLGNKIVPSFREIKNHRPYIKNAIESYGLLCLLTEGKQITRKSVKQKVAKDQKKAHKFSDEFFLEKTKFINENPKKFCELYSLYKFMNPFLKGVMRKERVYIVTNNRKEQISMVLQNEGIYFDESKILDAAVSRDKKIHLRKIAELENVKTGDIVFVEDSIEHLKDTASMGIQPVLAKWGYVLPADVKEAKKLRFRVIDKTSLYFLLTTDNMNELFTIVDENNKVIGKSPRGEIHAKGIWHRAVHILVMNSKGELLLQKRSMTKDLYKGHWIDAAAGHVDAGESYESTAKRELKEELGISAKLTKLFDFKKSAGNDNEFIRVFIAKHDGPFKPHPEEVDYVKFFGKQEIENMMKKEKFTPATLEIFKIVRKNPDILKRFLK